MAKFGDNYYRSASAAKVASFISGQSMNINGSSTSCSGNAATATTASSCSGNSATATKVNSQGSYSNSAPGNTRGAAGLNFYEVYSNGYPTTYGNVLHISGGGAGQLLVGWSGTDGAQASNYIRSKRDNDSGAWSSWAEIIMANSRSYSGSLTMSDNITAYSDLKLKQNIFTIDSALEKVKNLRGVYYTRKDDETNKRKVGVIAQEIELVLPEVVMKNVKEETKEETLSVDYGNITALLIEAMKEQQATIESLKDRILVLENTKN